MSLPTIRVVAAVVDTTHLTLYRDNGETVQIPQGDSRVRNIVTEITPLLIAQGYADVSLRSAEENHYAKFEEQSKGMVRFFRIAKDRLKGLFSKETMENDPTPVPNLSIGTVPIPPGGPLAKSTEVTPKKSLTTVFPPMTMADVPAKLFSNAADAIEEFGENELERFAAEQRAAPVEAPVSQSATIHAGLAVPVAKMMSAVDQILEHAVPVTAPEFHEDTVAKQGNVVEATGHTDKSTADSDHPDTIIAVVDNKIIPGMEKIKTQFIRASKLGSTTAVENFLKRLGSVIDQRKHSIDDLLKFMERADTPIAEDGSIIIYKVLRHKDDKTIGRYVDCHTKKVEQWTGAYVCMDPSLVDPNRNNECSNGLHVARRGYIRKFLGDVCVLAKLAPEDVIAVPSYDANKMRVCGYHILMELTDAQYSLLKANRPLTDDAEGQKLLANALAGRHVRRTHEVRITEQNGGGVVVTALAEAAPVQVPTAPKVVEALSNPIEETQDAPVDPNAVADQVKEAKLSRKEQAAKLYAEFQAGKEGALDALKAFQRSTKIGWERLGIPDPTVTTAQKAATKKTEVKAKKAKGKPMLAPALQPMPSDKRTVNDVELSEGSPRERIQKLLAIGITSVGVAAAILALKKRSKKSWDVLGVSEAQVAGIIKLAGNSDS